MFLSNLTLIIFKQNTQESSMKIKLLIILLSTASLALNSMDKPYTLHPLKEDSLEVIKNKIDFLYFVKQYLKSRNIPVSKHEESWVDTYHLMAQLMLETRTQLAKCGRLPAGAETWSFGQWENYYKHKKIT